MPERPESVPEDAFWDDEDVEWCLPERDAEGLFHGLVRWWRPNGTLCCETYYRNGTPHGTFKRFHENGEVSRRGAFEEGKLHGTNAFVRSSEESTERFPAGLGAAVARAEMDYERGRIVAARCYDAAGAQCMENGDPFPETRPDGVPEAAHFRKREGDGAYRWVVGEVVDNDDGTIERSGVWRWWTADGVLAEEHFYEDGEITGPQLRLLDEDERGEHAIKVRGAFDDEDPVGIIEYLDAAGVLVAAVDTGLPDDLEATQLVMSATEELGGLAEQFNRDAKLGAALFALTRAVGRGEAEHSRLVDAIAALERPTSEVAAALVTRSCKMVVSQIQRFGGGADKCVNHVFEGIRKGGFGWELLRFAAACLDDMGESEVALEVIDGAMSAPGTEAATFEYTRALIRASVGDADGARASVAALAVHDPGLAAGIDAYLRALFPTWGFWPTEDSRRAGAERLAALLERRTPKAMPTAADFRLAIKKSATRLTDHRQRLVERFGGRDFIVPDVSDLLPDGPVEVPISDAFDGIGIQHLCRQEWIRLTWLCYFAGLDEVALPKRVVPRDDHVALQAIGFTRLFMAYGADPSTQLEKLLAQSDVVSEETRADFMALAIELAGASDWFGLLLADAEDAPDIEFLRADEAAFIKVVGFSNTSDPDLFDEDEVPVDEEDEEDEDEEGYDDE